MAYEDPPIIYGDAADAKGYPLVPKTAPVAWSWNEHNRTRDLVAGISLDWAAITGKPGTFPPSPHTHDDRYYTIPFMDGVIGALDSNANSRVSKGGDTMSGQLYLPNSFAANSGYTVAYINGDGRVSRGASSERFKEQIDRDPELPDVFAVPIASYVMIGDDLEAPRYGPIAEDLDANPATAPFVVYDDENRPAAFDVISYLMAAVAQLNARVKELEARDVGTD